MASLSLSLPLFCCCAAAALTPHPPPSNSSSSSRESRRIAKGIADAVALATCNWWWKNIPSLSLTLVSFLSALLCAPTFHCRQQQSLSLFYIPFLSFLVACVCVLLLTWGDIKTHQPTNHPPPHSTADLSFKANCNPSSFMNAHKCQRAEERESANWWRWCGEGRLNASIHFDFYLCVTLCFFFFNAYYMEITIFF